MRPRTLLCSALFLSVVCPSVVAAADGILLVYRRLGQLHLKLVHLGLGAVKIHGKQFDRHDSIVLLPISRMFFR